MVHVCESLDTGTIISVRAEEAPCTAGWISSRLMKMHH